MKYLNLGNSNLKVSRIGMGCWAIGGQGWGPIDDNQSVEAIKAALEVGINFFDTADVYGLGHSEEILGKVLAPHRRQVIIATKVGLAWNSKGKIKHNLSPSYIKSACDSSLKRLQTDYIDLYQTHWPDEKTPFSDTLEALGQLVASGKVRYVGSCNLPLSLASQTTGLSWFISLQDRYHLFYRKAEEEIIPFCRKYNLGFIAYEPLFKGILTGKFRQIPKFPKGDHRKWETAFQPPAFSVYQKKVEKLSKEAKSLGITTAQLSLSKLLKTPGVSCLIPGAKTKGQVSENAAAANLADLL